MIKVDTIQHIQPLLRGECSQDQAHLFCRQTQKYYRLYLTCTNPKKLTQLGINYPIKIDLLNSGDASILFRRDLHAKEIRLKDSSSCNRRFYKVSISTAGELVLDPIEVDSGYFEPSDGSKLLIKESVLIGNSNAVEQLFTESREAEKLFYNPNKDSCQTSKVVKSYLWFGNRYTYILTSYLENNCRRLNPKSYYNFVKDLRFRPYAVKSYFTKDELLEYDRLRREGWVTSSSLNLINIDGVQLSTQNRWLVRRIRGDGYLVKCCEEELFNIKVSADELDQHLPKILESAIGSLQEKCPSLETLLMLETRVIEMLLAKHSPYQAMAILEKVLYLKSKLGLGTYDPSSNLQ